MKIPFAPVYRSVGRLVGQSVGLSDTISLKGGNYHFNAPISEHLFSSICHFKDLKMYNLHLPSFSALKEGVVSKTRNTFLAFNLNNESCFGSFVLKSIFCYVLVLDSSFTLFNIQRYNKNSDTSMEV